MLIQYSFIWIYIGCSVSPIKEKNLSHLAVNYTVIPVIGTLVVNITKQSQYY